MIYLYDLFLKLVHSRGYEHFCNFVTKPDIILIFGKFVVNIQQEHHSKTTHIFISYASNQFYRLIQNCEAFFLSENRKSTFSLFCRQSEWKWFRFRNLSDDDILCLWSKCRIFAVSLPLHFLSLLSRFRDASSDTRNIKEFLNTEYCAIGMHFI